MSPALIALLEQAFSQLLPIAIAEIEAAFNKSPVQGAAVLTSHLAAQPQVAS